VSGLLLVDEDYLLKLENGTAIPLIIKGNWKVGDRIIRWQDLPIEEGMRIEVVGHYKHEEERLKVEEIRLEDGTF